ncbi:MAG: hypothetical protein JXB88_02060 [Spirochaetales bacterium]|nr:hypothetical protein [Spirochaetales bacterium]
MYKKYYYPFFSLFIFCLFILSLIIPGCRTRNDIEEEKGIREMKPEEFKKTVSLVNSSITYYDKDSDIFASRESTIQESDESLEIVDYGPVEELPVEMRKPTIYVLFSQPVVPLARLGEIMTTSDIMTISPSIHGIYRWYGSKLLSFEPQDKFVPQREYRVSIIKTLKSLGGKTLTGKNEFTFHTEYLDIADFYPGSPYAGYSFDNVPLDEAKKITISFTYPVTIDIIKDYITVTSNGKKYRFTISRPENKDELNENYISRTVVLSIDEDFNENSQVVVTLSKGAKSEADCIGRPDDIIKTYHTIIPFTYLEHTTYSYSFPRSERGDANPVYLEFSQPVKKESALKNIHVSLDVRDMSEHLYVWGNFVKLTNLPVTYGGFYTVDIGKNVQDIYGRQLDKNYSAKITVHDASSYYYFPNYGTRMLESAFEPKIIFEHQNIFDGVWRIDSITDPYSTFPPETLTGYDFSYAKKNVKHYRIINLSPWLNQEKKGFVGISWNFNKKDKKGIRPGWGQNNLQVQVTDLGITTRYAYNKIIVMVASLSKGEPVEGARVLLETESAISMFEYTDKNGIAIFPFKEGEYRAYFTTKTRVSQPRITVQNGMDRIVFIPNSSHDHYHFDIYNTTTINHAEDKRMKTYIFTDRGIYKPGETLFFGGMDRDIKLGHFSVYQGPYEIKVKEDYWEAEPFYTATGTTNAQGTFSGSFDLPETLEPGYYSISYQRDNQFQEIYFQVAHFKRLAFSVKMTTPDITCYTGDTIPVKCEAAYLAGGFMGNADYEYYWTKTLTHFIPPGKQWQSYRFGPNKYEGAVHVSSGSGKLSGNGQADITQITSLETKGGTYSYECEARVTDIDRQVIAARKSVLVHPASFYIGARIESGTEGYWTFFVPKGKKTAVAYTFATPEGKEYQPVQNQLLKARLYHVDWKAAVQKGVYGRMYQQYERVEELEDEKEISVKSTGGTFDFTPRHCGSYFIECELQDSTMRDALTRFYFYATGSSWIYWGFDNPQDIRLVPDKEIYNPGEKVRLLVQSSLPEAEYLLTIEREGILEEKIISLKGSANVIDIPVKEEYLPVVYVTLSTFSGRTEDPPGSYFEPDMGKPKGYFGITGINVSKDLKRIDIEIIPENRVYKPGSDVGVAIKASYRGKPLSGAEIIFLAADRGVLDLINYHVPDPLLKFYSPENFPLCTTGADSRSLLIDPVTYEIKDLPGGGGKGAQEEPLDETGETEKSGLDIRKDFRALAVFRAGLVTDSTGSAECRFTLPDTLTTYRMTAIAVKDDLFGRQEEELMVQNPLNVRTALTRRLRIRDTSFAGVVITNLDTKSHDVKVKAESDIIKIDDTVEKSILIPPNSSVEVPFTLLAVMNGEAKICFTVYSDILKERLEETIIVEKPLVKETFTITGKTSSMPDVKEPSRVDEGIIIPDNIAEGYGGLSLVLDSTRLASLSESIKYLYNYPYGCIEQHLSMLIPLIVFGDKLEAFGLSFGVINIKETIELTIERIARFQNSDGGVPFWLEGGLNSSPYCSIKLAHVLYLAKKYGYQAPLLNESSLLSYIAGINQLSQSRYIKIYALYIQSLFGNYTESRAETFFREEKLNSLTLYAFLGLIFLNNNNKSRSEACLKKIKNYIKAGTQTIDIVESHSYGYYFDSDIQGLALILMLYRKLDPASDFIEKITTTLMKRQKYGYWVNTSDTGWALLVFSELLENESGQKTDFTASVLIDESELLKTSFSGISRKSYTHFFLFDENPLSGFARNILLPLSFVKEGTGNLFYTASLTYALPSEVIRARDEGFSLFSEINDLDGNKLTSSELKPGETYRMRVVISSSRQRNFVVLRVPVPSGGEILDASFATTATYREKGGIDESTRTLENAYGDEYDFLNTGYYTPRKKIYDNEVQYFFDNFFRGRQEVEFLFRLTTPGIYPTPPVYAECMYEEEVFGRTDGEIYVIRE